MGLGEDGLSRRERRDADGIQGVASATVSRRKLFYIVFRGLDLGLSHCDWTLIRHAT